MRTFATLLLLTVLTAGCATGPSFTSVQPDRSGANTRVNPVAIELAEGVSRDAQLDADKTTTPAKVAAAIKQTGRVIKCAAVGAVAGLVVLPAVMALTGPVSVTPASWSALALLGTAGGVAMAFDDTKREFC